MLSEYFRSNLEKLSLEIIDQDFIKGALSQVYSSIASEISNNTLAIADKRKRYVPKPPKVEELPSEKSKHDKQTREEYFKEHQKKVDETKEFTKKLISERILREKRQQEKDEQARIKAMQDLESQRERQKEIQRKLEIDKQKRLAEMLQKSENRKKQNEGLREQINQRKPSQKPLYKQMEDAFKQQVVMPTLEQQKAELAKKRILYQPINPEEIKEHSRRHEELRREQEYKRKKELEQRNLEAQVNLVSNNLQSKFTAAILEEERSKKEEIIRLQQERKGNLQKKQQYAKLVKEMFPPIISEGKKFEFDDKKRSHKALRTALSGHHSRDGSLLAIKAGPGDYKSELGEVKISKRVWKENKMVKKLEPKKEPKVVDYLLERRNINKDKPDQIQPIEIDLQKEVYDEELDEFKAKKIKAKAEKMERMAEKQERMIGFGKVDSYRSLQAGDQVNDMILSSIKTKLALLDKFNAKN